LEDNCKAAARYNLRLYGFLNICGGKMAMFGRHRTRYDR
jgi:hypothetical protein